MIPQPPTDNNFRNYFLSTDNTVANSLYIQWKFHNEMDIKSDLHFITADALILWLLKLFKSCDRSRIASKQILHTCNSIFREWMYANVEQLVRILNVYGYERIVIMNSNLQVNCTKAQRNTILRLTLLSMSQRFFCGPIFISCFLYLWYFMAVFD